ncbi:AAA family ATPase [Sphingomonas sp. GV3]|uniref:ExeA family protein n=1 Tax=Sphingomonas sp. GV3 TaxID=3040671 RepID=UPI00280B0B92|nr:AAA family ATPase [Sphingomonas sp. GV3]
MYEDHYGLTGRPFQLTPDARFWYETATHRKAMAYLGYGLAQGEGFIVITGEVGAGKTTLVGHLTEQLDRQALNVITIVSTAIEASDLLRIVATGLGVDPGGLTKAQLLTAIERGLHAVARTGRRTLLIVDEVQALPVDSVEELRMLSNFQAGGHALLQILLLGQPEFRERLQGSARLEQLRQRVIAIHHLDPMEPHEVADYIAHRLSLVGWQGQPDFSEDAFDALYRGSGGVPRRLNLLAGRVMLQASLEDRALIDGRLVRSVVRDISADLPGAGAQPAGETPAPASAAAEPERRFVPRTTRWLDFAPAEEPAPAASTLEQADVEVPPNPAVAEDTGSSTNDMPVTPVRDEALHERVALLETRIEEQERALRRVLTLLVDWVEADRDAPSATAVHAVADAPPAPVVPTASDAPDGAVAMPIRAPTAWDDAA